MSIITPEQMKEIREELRMFRPAFAERVGVSPRMIKYYEDGEKEIPLRVHNSVKWVRHCYRLRKLKEVK